MKTSFCQPPLNSSQLLELFAREEGKRGKIEGASISDMVFLGTKTIRTGPFCSLVCLRGCIRVWDEFI